MDIPQYAPFKQHICKVWGGQLSNGKWWLQIILNKKNEEQLVIESIYPDFRDCVVEGLNALEFMFPDVKDVVCPVLVTPL